MATFNSTAIVPADFAASQLLTVYPSVQDFGALALAVSPISVVWVPEQETVQPFGSSLFTVVIPSQYGRLQYTEGFYEGEIFGFSSQQEDDMEPIQLGETDNDKKTISFTIYDVNGYPASGLVGEGAVATPVLGNVQTNRDLAGYVNSAGTFAHVADGEYRYTFANAEVASGGGEGNIWLRVGIDGFRTVVRRIPIRDINTPTKARDAVLNAARSGFVGTGTVGEGISIAASLLQGNYYMDQVVNGTSGQTSARIRCFHTGAAAAAATNGGSGEGEFATFTVTTTYAGANKIATHRVVQQ